MDVYREREGERETERERLEMKKERNAQIKFTNGNIGGYTEREREYMYVLKHDSQYV